jgi:DNA-binding beta-propeller fold protein YncE
VIVLGGTGVVVAAASAAYAAHQGPSTAQGPDAPGRATVYVVSQGSKTVTPVFAATRTAGRPIKVANGPDALAVGRDGKTVWLVSTNYGTISGHGFVTPIRTASNMASGRIRVGKLPFDVAVTPDGKTAWVVNYKTVTPVDTRTGRAAGRFSLASVSGITPMPS